MPIDVGIAIDIASAIVMYASANVTVGIIVMVQCEV